MTNLWYYNLSKGTFRQCGDGCMLYSIKERHACTKILLNHIKTVAKWSKKVNKIFDTKTTKLIVNSKVQV